MDDPVKQIEADCSASGIPLRSVLKHAGVAASTYWRWREGDFEPRPSTLRKLRQSLSLMASSTA